MSIQDEMCEKMTKDQDRTCVEIFSYLTGLEINKSTLFFLEPGVKFLGLSYDYIQISKVIKFNLMEDLAHLYSQIQECRRMYTWHMKLIDFLSV